MTAKFATMPARYMVPQSVEPSLRATSGTVTNDMAMVAACDMSKAAAFRKTILRLPMPPRRRAILRRNRAEPALAWIRSDEPREGPSRVHRPEDARRPLEGGVAHRSTQLAVLAQPDQGIRQPLHVARRSQDPGLALDDDLADGPFVVGDDRHSGGRRFEDRQAERLAAARVHEDVEGGEQAPGIRLPSEEADRLA